MRIVFFGTPEFAIPSLEYVYEKHQVLLVVTRPDKPAGRGRKLVAPPIKQRAVELDLDVVQADKINEGIVERIRALNPDVCVVVAFGLFLPKGLRSIPRACINIHPSLLPKYRGAAPIQRAIINGDKYTGVTIMHLSGKLDAGDIILQRKVPILDEDTAETLSDRLAKEGANLLLQTLELIERGEDTRTPQDDNEVTWADPIKKEDGHIDWTKSALEIRNLVRGVVPWPVAYTLLPDKRAVKVFPHVDVVEIDNIGVKPGTIIQVRPDVIVACGEDGIKLKDVQLPGKKRVSATSLVNGRVFEQGMQLE